MSTISLKVEAFAGTTIEDACRDLCALADRVGILCEVGFNGVKVWAYPGTDPAQLVKAWGVQMERPEHIYRIASARPTAVRGPGPEQIGGPADTTSNSGFRYAYDLLDDVVTHERSYDLVRMVQACDDRAHGRTSGVSEPGHHTFSQETLPSSREGQG